MAGQYEFTPEQNDILADLSRRVNFAAKLGIIIGIFESAEASFIGFKYSPSVGITCFILGGLLWLLVSMWHFKSAKQFRKIVDTEGSDISHLMDALKNMQRYYTLMYCSIIGAIIGGAIVIGLDFFHKL